MQKITSTQRNARRDPAPQPSAYHRLDALLHTIRCIAQYEDPLCELSHEVKRTGAISPKMGDEIGAILEKIPSHDFMLDLEAVKSVVSVKQSSSKSNAKTASKPTRPGVPPIAAKKGGTKPSK